MQTFEASHSMKDTVEFRPMYWQQQKYGIGDEKDDGVIVGVLFTEAKVFYNIYSPYWGIIFEKVASDKVYKIKEGPAIDPTSIYILPENN